VAAKVAVVPDAATVTVRNSLPFLWIENTSCRSQGGYRVSEHAGAKRRENLLPSAGHDCFSPAAAAAWSEPLTATRGVAFYLSRISDFPTWAKSMPLVTVKDKFQVTIPAKLRDQVTLNVGDILEASVESGAIVLRPQAVVDRATLASRLEDLLTRTPPAPEFAGASDEQVMDEVISEIDRVRAGSRDRP
jgi:AbrB family looped-hinge helix DNA binding protein